MLFWLLANLPSAWRNRNSLFGLKENIQRNNEDGWETNWKHLGLLFFPVQNTTGKKSSLWEFWSTTTSKRCVMTFLCRITKRKLSHLHFRSLPWIPQRSITQSMVVTAFQMTRPKRKRESFPKENKCLKRSPKDTIRLEGTVLKDSVTELTSCF